ncbi:DUF2314 domain-containing protein [Myroides odoratimimus]|uniref:DUF2314 domain-containing protein n=1 Tax=Myroides odoratimimus CIP 101113 TaxID=883154 RepID=A0AAV3F0J6_9FLAO|nr:DUF2314 domain-containing protein [Myroides odoratimimus]EHO08801.1 hypothetical protein HMPREF9715_02585 [Myroides odoratimimus CIP 101113]EPH13808.1 hypothetical protein HMPREF9713_00380 [Myroides odoratimimus CCUG 12700]MDM1035118.1 DUF2314 domain-containing protein [Myroides odoratimimus]MDM1038869.1 DUF2314 domain-containing protein [Myroides odoratimimus]MDM1052951.1 DUF2314 domain-containing protein [Myroides odoratimimus]
MEKENPIFYAKGDDPILIEAYKKAQDTFKYFWRELSWEYRRIVPAFDMASVKVAFTQEVEGEEEPVVEHMWIGDVDFDGDIIYGELLNQPNILTNIEEGEQIGVTLDQISDWMFISQGKAFGGFTVQAMRSVMTDEERAEHDAAWGLEFGDFNDVVYVYEQKEHPENLIEHPMSKNMKESLEKFLDENPDEVTNKDEAGYTFLHKEVISGNLTSVEVLLAKGANKNEPNNEGKTPVDYAKQLNWEHIIPVLG